MKKFNNLHEIYTHYLNHEMTEEEIVDALEPIPFVRLDYYPDGIVGYGEMGLFGGGFEDWLGGLNQEHFDTHDQVKLEKFVKVYEEAMREKIKALPRNNVYYQPQMF